VTKRLEFKTWSDFSSSHVVKETGSYYLCDCPECGKPEAFVYKNNDSFLKCSRENNCGESFWLDIQERSNEKGFVKKENINKFREEQTLTAMQIKQSEWLYLFLDHMQNNCEQPALENGYRGLSHETTKSFIVDMINETGMKFILSKFDSLVAKDYTNADYMTSRNIVIPLRDHKNKRVEALLLRSTLKEMHPKEIYLSLTPNPKPFIIDLPPRCETVYITESVIDGLSIREVDKEAGLIMMRGVNSVNSLINHLRKNQEIFNDKFIILALDNDLAGEKCASVLKYFFEKDFKPCNYNGVWDFFPVTFDGKEKDVNELLMKNPNKLERMVAAVSEEIETLSRGLPDWWVEEMWENER